MMAVTATPAAAGARLTRFNPPGGVEDLTESQKEGWSKFISDTFDVEIEGRIPEYYVYEGPRPQFFNPLKTDPAPDRDYRVISWPGFPKLVEDLPDVENRWQIADSSRDYQDEYCEWSVERVNGDPKGKITKVTFTCEGPEYWQFLGQTNPERVVQLYRQFISPQVQPEDLFLNGEYQPVNKWNQTGSGAMHLIQINNTLGAEIDIAAASTHVRRKEGRIVTEQQELIECGKYGNKGRNSDPLIGFSVNAQTRDGYRVSLADPVGLYFGDFDPKGWETPDNSDPKDYWKILRGKPDTPVRAVFEVPKEKNFTVSDITILGDNILYGAQIAKYVHIKLTAMVQQKDPKNVHIIEGCRKRVPEAAAFAAPLGAPTAAAETTPTKRDYRFSTRV